MTFLEDFSCIISIYGIVSSCYICSKALIYRIFCFNVFLHLNSSERLVGGFQRDFAQLAQTDNILRLFWPLFSIGTHIWRFQALYHSQILLLYLCSQVIHRFSILILFSFEWAFDLKFGPFQNLQIGNGVTHVVVSFVPRQETESSSKSYRFVSLRCWSTLHRNSRLLRRLLPLSDHLDVLRRLSNCKLNRFTDQKRLNWFNLFI